MNNFFVRSLTGTVYVLLLLGAFWAVPISSGLSATGLLFLFFLAAWKEFRNLAQATPARISNWPGLAFLSLGLSGAWAYASGKPWGEFLLLLLIPLVAILLISEVYRKEGQPILNLGVSFLGLVYLGLPLFSVPFLLFTGGSESPDPNFLMALFILIWANDSFAYVFGVRFGKHRLLERVSPKKSWEGAIGGGISTLAVSWLIYFWLGNLSLAHWLIFALIVVVAGTLGDLIESLLKRSVSIKDSGSLLPGHGGFLDRLDSFFLAAPLILVYLKCIL